MEFSEANSALDQKLPKELRGSVEYLGPMNTGEIVGGAKASTSQSEETNMSGTPTTSTLTNEQVRAIASEEATKLFAQANSQAAVASSIEKHVLAVQAAQSEVAQAKAELEKVQKDLLDSQAAAKKAADEVVTAKEADAKSKKEHGDKEEAQKKATAAIETELATAKKKLAEYDAKDKKALREKAIADAGVKSEKFKGRAIASNEDGTLKMSDDDFTVALEELKETVGGEPAKTTEGGTGTEQAVASPVAAPKDGDGPAGKQGAPKGTPVAAPTDKKGPAAGQSGSNPSHASTEATTEKTVQATASVPAQPNLNDAQMFAQAAAALTAPTVVTPAGKSQYANAFKAS